MIHIEICWGGVRVKLVLLSCDPKKKKLIESDGYILVPTPTLIGRFQFDHYILKFLNFVFTLIHRFQFGLYIF